MDLAFFQLESKESLKKSFSLCLIGKSYIYVSCWHHRSRRKSIGDDFYDALTYLVLSIFTYVMFKDIEIGKYCFFFCING